MLDNAVLHSVSLNLAVKECHRYWFFVLICDSQFSFLELITLLLQSLSLNPCLVLQSNSKTECLGFCAVFLFYSMLLFYQCVHKLTFISRFLPSIFAYQSPKQASASYIVLTFSCSSAIHFFSCYS